MRVRIHKNLLLGRHRNLVSYVLYYAIKKDQTTFRFMSRELKSYP